MDRQKNIDNSITSEISSEVVKRKELERRSPPLMLARHLFESGLVKAADSDGHPNIGLYNVDIKAVVQAIRDYDGFNEEAEQRAQWPSVELPETNIMDEQLQSSMVEVKEMLTSLGIDARCFENLEARYSENAESTHYEDPEFMASPLGATSYDKATVVVSAKSVNYHVAKWKQGLGRQGVVLTDQQLVEAVLSAQVGHEAGHHLGHISQGAVIAETKDIIHIPINASKQSDLYRVASENFADSLGDYALVEKMIKQKISPEQIQVLLQVKYDEDAKEAAMFSEFSQQLEKSGTDLTQYNDVLYNLRNRLRDEGYESEADKVSINIRYLGYCLPKLNEAQLKEVLSGFNTK